MQKFLKDWYEVSSLNRGDFNLDEDEFIKKFENIDVIINLIWAPIIWRWTEKYKKILYSSRIETTKKIVSAISKLEKNPKLFINTSAVWIYKQQLEHNEDSKNFDKWFLWKICINWEKEALKNNKNCRTIITRFWVILWKWWFLQKLLPIFKLWIWWKIWNWEFTMNFVDIEGIYRFYKNSIQNKEVKWIFNLSNINIKNKDFTKIFAKTLNRFAILPVPKFALKLLYWEWANIIFSDMIVNHKKTLNTWFEFKNDKLENILKKYI